MKKLLFVVVFFAVFAAGIPVFAQVDHKGQESEYYYINISLEKIWPYRLGYVVQYRKGVSNFARAYLPGEWFHTTGGTGDIVKLPKGQAWPSMTVYYKNGEFAHVRLYVHPWHSHWSWGVVPQHINIDHMFKDVETLELHQ
jgi:hypothetical protein